MRQCRECGGHTDVYGTKKTGGEHYRYLKCVKCGATQKQHVPDEFLRTSRRNDSDLISPTTG